MKIEPKFIFLDQARPENGIQHFAVGLEDGDGPLFTYTTDLESGYFIDNAWWQQQMWDTPGLNLIIVLQSYSRGMKCFNWFPAFPFKPLTEMYIDGTRIKGDYGVLEVGGVLLTRELRRSDFETFQRFDGGITPHFNLRWREEKSDGYVQQVAP